VQSINQVAHVLGLKTIAEWAENEHIINQLRALNVDYAQGFAIGTPLPVVDVAPDFATNFTDGPNLGPNLGQSIGPSLDPSLDPNLGQSIGPDHA
jgi:predicted signal transduction protein with EAL and GGDEF domain